LRDDPLAKVAMLMDDEVAEFEFVISAKYPALPDCWGAMDGLKL
jgi:hypothetical protein